MTNPTTPDRRHTPRLPMRGDASLMTTRNKWPAHVLDVSLNGALVALIEPYQLDNHEEAILTLDLPGGERIKLQGRVVHQKEHYIGLECSPVSIEYHARLKQLLSELDSARQDDRSLQQMLSEMDD
ncbi:PilZ domain-containing protein [Pseudomaricurvus sp. HS19]|uniref:PilZ domain-containing protein n=1 Tax=Pseudomaricurvus sp. HS19 TaxID=2692626 RepID=UPI001369D2D0|nr:PilZ domain-containing protein [Pseudomaricurvus sp. HS19]MYM63165.1 hypothetical protein [Pseudomaricurvus sp. HS19]